MNSLYHLTLNFICYYLLFMNQNYLYLPYDLSNEFLYLIVSQNLLIANLGTD